MKKIALVLLIVGICYSSNAQVVNIESRRMQSDTNGWAGGAGAGFSIQQYTTRILSFNVEAHVQYKRNKDLWLFLADNLFLKGGDQKLISNSFGHFRYNRKITNTLRWEAFTQVQNNLVTQMKLRWLIGTGPRIKAFSSKKFRVYVASLAMYEHEEESTEPIVKHNDLRSSSYVSFTWLPEENIELTATTFFQPLFNNINDNRIFNQAVFRVKASKHFGLAVKWNYLHDTKPAGNAPKTNYSFITGLDFSF